MSCCHSDRSRSERDGEVEEPAFEFPPARRPRRDGRIRPSAGPEVSGRSRAMRVLPARRISQHAGTSRPEPRAAQFPKGETAEFPSSLVLNSGKGD